MLPRAETPHRMTRWTDRRSKKRAALAGGDALAAVWPFRGPGPRALALHRVFAFLLSLHPAAAVPLLPISSCFSLSLFSFSTPPPPSCPRTLPSTSSPFPPPCVLGPRRAVPPWPRSLPRTSPRRGPRTLRPSSTAISPWPSSSQALWSRFRRRHPARRPLTPQQLEQAPHLQQGHRPGCHPSLIQGLCQRRSPSSPPPRNSGPPNTQVRKEFNISEFWCGRVSHHTPETIASGAEAPADGPMNGLVRTFSNISARLAHKSQDMRAPSPEPSYDRRATLDLSEAERQQRVMNTQPSTLYERFRRGLLEYHSEVGDSRLPGTNGRR